jgi:hypothetical protein
MHTRSAPRGVGDRELTWRLGTYSKWILVLLVALATVFFYVLTPSNGEGLFCFLEPVPLPDTVADYEAQCRTPVNDIQLERCRRALPVFRHSFMWVDSRLLLRDGEELSSKHLDVLHGFPEASAEPARVAVSSHLASWCRQEGLRVPTTFNELKARGCTERLPTLAEMGLELDPRWAGVYSVDSSYSGRPKTREDHE